MSAVVDRYLAEHVEYHGLSNARRTLVVRLLGALETHAGVPVEQVTDVQLRQFLADQLANGLNVNTVRKHNHALKPFFRWAWRVNIVTADRWMRIQEVPDPRGSSDRARPRPYKRKELVRWWEQLDATYPQPTDLTIARFKKGRSKYRAVWRHAMHLQTQAIVGLALFGGLRREEIFRVEIDDIHPDNAFIVVRYGARKGSGDGDGYREVPYTVEGRRYVDEWLNFRHHMRPGHDRPWLVLSPTASPNGRLPSSPSAPMRFGAFATLLGRVGPWEYHRFRHTCATEWLRAGMKLERVQKLLGHADISETLGYTELVREDVARSAQRHEGLFMAAVGRKAA